MTYDLYHPELKPAPEPFDAAAAFAGTGAGHISDYPESSTVKVNRGNIGLPSELDEIEIVPPSLKLSKAQELEQGVLTDSLADAKAGFESVDASITLFCARRDIPERYKQILVALRELIRDIETERTVFERAVEKAPDTR